MSESSEQAGQLPDLEDELDLRDLPKGVVELREKARERDAILAKVVQPRVKGLIGTCRSVAGELQTWHSEVADRTDLDPYGYSRGAAVWLLSGRSLGLLEVLFVQAEAGVDNEAIVVGRALHEANRTLFAFLSDPGGEELVRIWLEDKGKRGYVKQGAARAVNDRYEEKLNEVLVGEGKSPIGTTRESVEDLYDRLSRTTHNRRSSCLSSYWPEGRKMAYGIAPNQLRWATAAEWTASMTVDVANSVGDALGAFYGRKFFSKKVAPLIVQVEAVRHSLPLDPEAILAAANLPSRLQ